MSDIRFLVTGATGAIGSAAATQLLDKGRRVRAFVHREDERSESLRRRGAEVVVGDLLDFDVVREALKGVNRAYFVYPIRPGPPRREGRRVMTRGRSIRRPIGLRAGRAASSWCSTCGRSPSTIPTEYSPEPTNS